MITCAVAVLAAETIFLHTAAEPAFVWGVTGECMAQHLPRAAGAPPWEPKALRNTSGKPLPRSKLLILKMGSLKPEAILGLSSMIPGPWSSNLSGLHLFCAVSLHSRPLSWVTFTCVWSLFTQKR